MLNRRILRVKAFKAIYGYSIAREKQLDDVLAELRSSCESTRDLWLFLIGLIGPVAADAAERIDAAKSKFNPTEEELHPNEKLALSPLAAKLAEDPDFQKLMAKKKFSWKPYDVFIRHLGDQIRKRKYYNDYLTGADGYRTDGAPSLTDDVRFFSKVFETELEDNEELAAILEDMSIWWTDDLGYALYWVIRSLDRISIEGFKMIPLYNSESLSADKVRSGKITSDEQFVKKLVANAFSGYENYFSMVQDEVKDWKGDRLFATDVALIITALAEARTFPDIPLRVTMNEYIEISKFYCSPKSRSFVNGVLDKLVKNLQNDGKINKN